MNTDKQKAKDTESLFKTINKIAYDKNIEEHILNHAILLKNVRGDLYDIKQLLMWILSTEVTAIFIFLIWVVFG
jgi:hypothetical protein